MERRLGIRSEKMGRKKNRSPIRIIALAALAVGATLVVAQSSGQKEDRTVIDLPDAKQKGTMSVEEALRNRRSVRSYADEPVALSDVAQLLWSAQGVTSGDGLRTAPSAGALYPLELYLVAGRVDGLDAGVYRYRPKAHELVQIAEGDRRGELADAALGQSCVKDGPASIVFAAVYERTARKYGDRARRYAHIEVGHAAQNVGLQAVALNLATVPVGAFENERVQSAIGMERNEKPLYILPLGKAK
ncbi:MAG: SagB/ThcOx family dehydrogenase [Planctomycetota bacterium]|nr:SagB/ThcOx family dehydrogenase [Planctomycetota bacterium]